ncbi:ester cyclase [Ancylobacter sp.]|uniref:ester cyclase n=1 Tax=Ancylobacter sp. TaxID=1872567 RepID=UPI003D14C2E8
MTEDNKQLVRDFIERAINGHDPEVAGDYVAEDMVEQVPFPGQGPGLAGLKDVLRGLFSAFPDMHWTVEEQIAEADKVLTRFTWTATHGGAFFGMPASGSQVSVWGMVIDRIEDGRIKDTRILMDLPALMRQIGAGA